MRILFLLSKQVCLFCTTHNTIIIWYGVWFIDNKKCSLSTYWPSFIYHDNVIRCKIMRRETGVSCAHIVFEKLNDARWHIFIQPFLTSIRCCQSAMQSYHQVHPHGVLIPLSLSHLIDGDNGITPNLTTGPVRLYSVWCFKSNDSTLMRVSLSERPCTGITPFSQPRWRLTTTTTLF